MIPVDFTYARVDLAYNIKDTKVISIQFQMNIINKYY